MATKFGYVETSDLAATYGTGHIHSVKCPATAQNGFALKLGDLTTNEVREATLAGASDKIVLLAEPALKYEQISTASQAEWYFCPEKDSLVRAYDVVKDDRFAVSSECVGSGTATKGSYVTVADGKFVVVAEKPVSTTGFVGKIFAIEKKSEITLIRIVVLLNA